MGRTAIRSAAVRVVHASPDAPAVDVWVAGVDAPVFTSLGFGDTTAYADLDEGDYTIELRAAGAVGSAAGDFRLVLVDAATAPWVAIDVTPDE